MENQDGSNAPEVDVNVDPLEGVNLDEIDTQNASPEQIEALKKASMTFKGQKEHFKSKYERDAIDPETGKRYADLYKEAKQTPPTAKPDAKTNNGQPTQPADADDVKKDVAELKLYQEKAQFQHQNKLSPEETDDVFAFAKGRGITPAEALKHPFISSGIEAQRKAAEASDATPGPSSKSPVKVGGKTIMEMTPEEREKNWRELNRSKGK